MKKSLTTLLLVVFITTATLHAQREFWVKSFVPLPNDITARVESRIDDNNKKCAVIKIYTDLTGLSFDSNLGFCGDDIPYKAGIYTLYVSPGERRLMIQKDGFMPKEYIIEDYRVKELDAYKLTLTQKGGTAPEPGKKSDFVKIYSTPSGADLYLEGELKGTTPFEQLVQEGSYIYLIKKAKYYDAEGDIQVRAGNTEEINVTLKPKFGKIIVNSTPSGADINV